MRKIYFLTSMLMFTLFQINAQMGVNKDGTAPHQSAMLDIKASSTTNAKGILMPRVADHTVITSPATGLMVFNTTTNTFWYFNGLAWTDMGNGGSSGAWLQDATNVYTNNNKVGINTANPQTTLDVKGDGFVVSQKTKLTTEDPNLRVYNMPLSNITFTDIAGTLYDPSGPNAPYPGGNINSSSIIFVGVCSRGDNRGCNSIGIKLTFEAFDTQANGDSVIITDGTNTLAKYSGNIIPPDFYHSGSFLYITLKTNGDLTVGQGFKIKWQAIERDGVATPITVTIGNALHFNVSNGAFRSGLSSASIVQNAGIYSVGMGLNTNSKGSFSFAVGNSTSASSLGSVATGYLTNASGNYATSMGAYTNASTTASFASGDHTISGGYASTSMGYYSNASGYASTALGNYVNASGYNATAMGTGTIASGFSSTAMGYNTTANGNNSTAMGSSTKASGDYSTAIGKYTLASGYASTSMGNNTNASGDYSTAMGIYSIASSTASFASGYKTISIGFASTSMGYVTNASGYVSTAMGYNTNASGYYSTAMGYNTNASGYISTAMGVSTVASGDYSTATGYNTSASGSYSTTMGSNVNANNEGSFVIGDSPNSSNLLYSQNSNSFNSRFRNGYYLYTSATLGTGAILFGGGNSWSSISDSTKKENFLPIDGENVLKKIANMRTVTWNYKGQNPKGFRHYGPMAQEFFSAFGRDKLGVIGNDTTIASADFDGINFTAIKALEKRTSELQTENELLKKRLAILEKSSSEIMVLKAKMEQLEAFLLPEKEKIRAKIASDK